jgi:hypothetical protein
VSNHAATLSALSRDTEALPLDERALTIAEAREPRRPQFTHTGE